MQHICKQQHTSCPLTIISVFFGDILHGAKTTHPLVGFAMLIIFSFFVDGIADIVVDVGIVSCTDIVVVGSHRHRFV